MHLATHIVIRWLINALALIVVDWLFEGVTIALWAPLLVGAAVLGIANTVLKPILALLTLPLIVVTFGASYFLLNILMLWIAESVSGDFVIDGFWTYVGAAVIVWLVNTVVARVLGVKRSRLHVAHTRTER